MKQNTKFLWMYIGILFSFALILIIFAGLSRNTDTEQKEGLKADLPKFKLSIPQLLLHQNIMQTLIVPYITLFVNKYRKAWRGFLPEYTQKWYSILLQAEPMGLCDKFRNIVYSHKGAVNEKISSSEVKYQETKSLIDGAFDKFKNLKEELLL